MNKPYRLIKRYIALILVLLFSIESFAAVVGDNDGAAFITKAEFDSMKNDFQSQLDRYNSSLDNKIDGAIASYLSGIKIKQKTDLPQLCSNYSLMRWTNDLYVYGMWRKFTNRTTYNSSAGKVWFKPSLNEKRYTLGETQFRIYDGIGNGYGYSALHWVIRFTSFGPGVTRTEYNSGSPRVPAAAMLMYKDSEGWYLPDNCLLNLGSIGCWKGVPPHFTGSGYNLTSTELVFHAMENVGTAGYFFDVKYCVDTASKGESTRAWYRSSITAENANFPSYWSVWRWNGLSQSNLEAQTQGWNNDTQVTDGVNGGCTYQIMDSAYYNQLVTTWRYMMLGQDNNTQVNVAKNKSYIYNESTFDMTDSTEETWAKGTIDLARLIIFANGASTVQNIKTLPTQTFEMKLAFLPTEYLRNLSTHQFKVNGTSLAYGDGLPLVINSNEKGYVHLHFDHSVKKILTGASATNKVYIDVKNKKFTDTTGTYMSGYSGHVDPGTTTSGKVPLQRYVNDDGTVDLTIPIEKEESIYIRISPYSSDMDLYASIANLNCVLTRD